MKRKGNTRSGSVVATTFYRGAGGVLSRQKTIPVNKNSVSQIKRRGMFAGASMAWKKLSADEQIAFHELAKRSPVVNSLGQSKVLSGQSFFVKKWMGKERATSIYTETEQKAADFLASNPQLIDEPAGLVFSVFGFDDLDEETKELLLSGVYEMKNPDTGAWDVSELASEWGVFCFRAYFFNSVFPNPATIAVFAPSGKKLFSGSISW